MGPRPRPREKALQVSSDEEALLDRGGRPTLRELLRQLVFSPSSGSIRLNKERLILQRASQTSHLRDQLVERYGRDDAFVMLTRSAFAAAQRTRISCESHGQDSIPETCSRRGRGSTCFAAAYG